MISPSLMRRTFPLALTGFFNAFNDSGFKLWAVLAVLGSRFDYFRDSAFLLSVAAVCILPPLLLPIPLLWKKHSKKNRLARKPC